MKRTGVSDLLMAIIILGMGVSLLQAAPGDVNWDDQFRIPGLNGMVHAAAVSGSDLYAGGSFTVAGTITASHIAKWNGSGWSPLGAGLNGDVKAIAISGSDVYVGGNFTVSGGSAANYIAKWNGVSWSVMGSGLNGEVTSIAVSGSDVYAGGSFTTAGGSSANNIAKWNGSGWSALGTGLNENARSIAISGSNVYVGGDFTMAGGSPANHIAKWNGSSWSAMGSGFDFRINTITVDGSDVYVGGFDWGSVVTVYKWNGSSWLDLDGGVSYFQNYPVTHNSSTQNVSVQAILISGSNVYVGGHFLDPPYGGSISVWNGSSWAFVGDGVKGDVYTMAKQGSDIIAGGYFKCAGEIASGNIAKWNGIQWAPLGSQNTPGGVVKFMASVGSSVYLGGSFSIAGGQEANHIAKWNGSSWSTLGTGLNEEVHSIAVSGSDVYAGGDFTAAGGSAANFIARWNGSGWSALGSGLNGPVGSLAVKGNNVYAGGNFTVAGGSAANHIAMWDGSIWHALPDLPSGVGASGISIVSMSVDGDDIYLAGELFDGYGMNHILRWNGSSWSLLGSGVSGGTILSVIAHEGEVYVCDNWKVSFWDGDDWDAIGNVVYDGFVLETGDGPAPYEETFIDTRIFSMAFNGQDLFIGGYITGMDETEVRNIAKWDGISWSALGSGIDGDFYHYYPPFVYSLAASSNHLYAGGDFVSAGDKSSFNFARYYLTGTSSGIPIYPHLSGIINPFGSLTSSSLGAAFGDYDGDGDADLIVANDNGENETLYRSEGRPNGTVSLPPLTTGGLNTTGAGWADYDNDGDLDLYLSQLGAAGSLYRNSAGVFTSATMMTDAANSFSSSWTDYNNDGYLDLFVAVRGGENRLYRNKGNGTFERIVTGPVVTGTGQNLMGSWCDYDLDGDEDLFVARTGGENNQLFENQGNGTFTKITAGSIVNDGGESWSGSWGDYDNDGWPDLYVANNGEANFLYKNNKNGAFTKITAGDLVTEGHHSRSSGWVDLDNDGDMDLFVSNKDEENRWYMNMGGGSFRKYTTGTSDARGACFGDPDMDGDMDLFIANDGIPSRYYENQNSLFNHWLEVVCEGLASNRSGIGARVKMKSVIKGISRWQTREITNHTGFGGGSEMIAHFGLREAVTADSLRIEWPSGIVWDTTAVAANQRLEIKERTTSPHINHRPVAENDTASVLEGNTAVLYVLENDTDPEGDPLCIKAVQTAGVKGTVAINPGDTTLTYTAPAEYSGEDAFQYVVSDDSGCLDTAFVMIEVRSVNHRPVAENDTASVLEGNTAVLYVLENDTDPDGDPLCIEAINTIGTVGSAVIDPGDTTLTYTADSGYTGEDTFLYVISDGLGGLDTAIVLVQVTTVNHPPVAVNDTTATRQDSTITVHVLENDYDPDGDALYIAGIVNVICSCIVSVDDGDTTVTYTPPGGFSGEMSFRYIVSDGNGGLDTASVVIMVEPGTSVEKLAVIPENYALYQNHPNPFNPTTEIRYDLPKEGNVRVAVFDITGKRIAVVVDEKQSAGAYRVLWNSCDSNGHPVPSGVYFYRIEAGEYGQVRKMLLVR